MGRFIPACAGNAKLGTHIGTRRPVHPRVCGERFAHQAHLRGLIGSSPRVRGTLQYLDQGFDVSRFIPACAGNAARMRSSTRR